MKKKDNRGGYRENSGRKPWNHELNIIRRLRAKAWFAQLSKDGGSVKEISGLFETTYWIEEALKKYPEKKDKIKNQEEENVFPCQDRLYKYQAGESGPGSDFFPKRIGIFFPETLKTWQSPIWAAANKPKQHMKTMERKYRRTVNVYSQGNTKEQLEDLRHFVERDNLDIDTYDSLEEFWELVHDPHDSSNDVFLLKLPRIVCDNLPTMEYVKRETFYLPDTCNRHDLKWELEQIDKEYRHQSTPETLKAEIRCYLLFDLIDEEKAVSDILSIDIATQAPLSLTEPQISNLPEGIRRIYNMLPEALQTLYTARN